MTSFVQATSAQSNSASALGLSPSTPTVGNIMLVSVKSSNGQSIAPPSGWTATNAQTGYWSGWKIATSSETLQWSVTSADNLVGTFAEYTVPAGAPVDAAGFATSLTAPSVTTTKPGDRVVVLWPELYNSTPLALPAGVTQRYLVNGSTFGSCGVGDFVQSTAGATPTQQATGVTGTGQSAVFALVGFSAPSASTLTAPGNASYVGTASGLTFTGIYNSTDGQNANARAMRVKSSGGAYSYYNASTNALQSTIVWNPVSITPGGSASFTLPATAFADGTTYNWSMADQEAGANLQGVFASDFTFTAQAPPTVTVTAPSGSTSTATPIMQWTATPDTGASITAWQAKVFSSTQYSAGGFNPATSTATWDSGVTAGSATSATVGVTLVNGVSYRFYVQVTETGGETSAWVYSTATVAFDPPAPPIVTATAGTDPTTGLPLVNLTVQGTDNLMSVNDASFEGGVGSWVGATNATVAQSTTQALDGSYSLAATATATGTMSFSTATGVSGYPVQVGQTYTGMVSARAAATSRNVTAAIVWYNASGTLLSTNTGTAVADTTTGWTQATVTASAPTSAAYATLKVTVTSAAASEVHYIDEAGIRPGSDTGWYRGGLVGSTTVAILRSDGLYVRGASTTNPLTIPSNQQASLVDAELVPANGYSYIGSVSVVISPTVTLTGPSSQASAQVTLTTGKWWQFDPTDLSTAIAAQVTDFNPQITEQAAAHIVLGQATPNVIANTMGGVDGTATFETFDTPTYQGLTKLLTSQKTVFISDPFGDNQGVTYVRFGPQTGGMSGGSGLKAKDARLHPSTSSAPHHELSVSWVAQPRPSV